MAKHDRKPELKVVEEAEPPSEEVLRLKHGADEGGVEARPVGKMPLPKPPEEATRLKSQETEEERRSHEPDIGEIIEHHDALPDLEQDWSDRRQPVPHGWFVLIAIVLVLAVAGSVIIGQRDEVTATEAAREASLQRLEKDEIDDRKAREMVKAAERRLADYLAADRVEDLLPHVRNPERVEPLIRDWYGRHELQPRKFLQLVEFKSLNIGFQTFWKSGVRMTGPDGGEEIEAFLLEQTGPLEMRVDWETAVYYQPVPWEEYLEREPRGEAMDFRVICEAAKSGPYSHEFRDDQAWRSVTLSARDSDEFTFGYFQRGTALERELFNLYQQARGRPLMLLLRLRRPVDLEAPRAVLIEEVVSRHWVVVDES